MNSYSFEHREKKSEGETTKKIKMAEATPDLSIA